MNCLSLDSNWMNYFAHLVTKEAHAIINFIQILAIN